MVYILFSIALIVLIGAIFENLDRNYIVKSNKKKGFIVARDAKDRFHVALGIYAVWTFARVVLGTASFLSAVAWILVAIPALMVGFVMGPTVGKLWGRKDELLKVVDKFQDHPEEAVEKAKERAKGWFERTFGAKTSAPPPKKTSATEASAPASDAPTSAPPSEGLKEKSAEEKLKEFTGG